MVLQLQEVDVEADFPAISRCLFDAHETPLQKFFHLWFPTFGDDNQAREDAITEGATRLKLWHSEDPSSNWRKVVDTESGRIAGASLWNIHLENPFATPDNMEVTWFPPGGAREFVEEMITEYDAPRVQAAQKPHVCVGKQLLNWGMEQADKLGLEVYLDSTGPGRPLYEANGFSYIQEHHIRPRKENPDREWQELEQKVGPIVFWPMKRAVSEGAALDKAG
ncbi:hypothetical protein DHEL01_v209191 [Diaporthe helianthi]|uniref:N-acetyltransferase domain-containing protein n=1 Tax=Diaporthe helianthi TaxID=158607 RepID=A0A2P5HQ75_DIAHE|nr:hypothetical protein DHEL01_v209191 [Diaporthe helianthi]